MTIAPIRKLISLMTRLSDLPSFALSKFPLYFRRKAPSSGLVDSRSLAFLAENLSSRAPKSEGASAQMTASVDMLAEQMLALVEIVSAQEQEIRALKEQCQRLEEHEQAIMVAFTTFFHVLAAGHVASLDEISGILRNITNIAEEERRPQEAIHFLQNLADMLFEQSHEKAAEGSEQKQSSGDRGD
jgi:hypothetical protein